jgi:hypothetical protein
VVLISACPSATSITLVCGLAQAALSHSASDLNGADRSTSLLVSAIVLGRGTGAALDGLEGLEELGGLVTAPEYDLSARLPADSGRGPGTSSR